MQVGSVNLRLPNMCTDVYSILLRAYANVQNNFGRGHRDKVQQFMRIAGAKYSFYTIFSIVFVPSVAVVCCITERF